jgi:hypothetical protein
MRRAFRKRILATCLTCLACSTVAISLFAQGLINWNNTSQTLISVNGSPMPVRVSPATTYYFGLFVAPLGMPPPAFGWAGIDDPNWQFVVAYATNSTVAAGRLQNSGTATVIGYAPETNVNFIVRGWQSNTGGADWWYAKQGVTVLGTSAVGTATLGGGAYPVAMAFGPGSSQISGFNIASACLECVPPWFMTNPSNKVVSLGSDVTLTAYALGYGGYTPNGPIFVEARYQWRKQGSPITGATNSSLILTNVALSDGGTYDVVASGTYGSTPSAPASVTIFIPAIAGTLGSPAYTANNQFQFTVTGSAGSNYVVQVATNLAAPTVWVSLLTNTSPFTFVDSNAQNFPQRFYRAQAR